MARSANCRVPLDMRTKRRLWSESGGYCQNPTCANYLFPDDTDIDFAEMAHVIPASVGGPRDVHIAQVGTKERAGHGNIAVLCANCHTIVDKAPESYSADLLYSWKQRHIERLRIALGTPLFRTRASARSYIDPLLEANRLIHRTYVPDSDVYREGDPTLWQRHVRSNVIPNNREVLRILQNNRGLLRVDEAETLALFDLHVQQLESRHIFGDWSAGTQRFPSKMASILRD